MRGHFLPADLARRLSGGTLPGTGRFLVPESMWHVVLCWFDYTSQIRTVFLTWISDTGSNRLPARALAARVVVLVPHNTAAWLSPQSGELSVDTARINIYFVHFNLDYLQ